MTTTRWPRCCIEPTRARWDGRPVSAKGFERIARRLQPRRGIDHEGDIARSGQS